ncbi:MAG: hypothetical protein JO048_03155 [Methylobacteriaceae bacterium]|nr:hypothetical protein [Methylobacteriaceae bacterium]
MWKGLAVLSAAAMLAGCSFPFDPDPIRLVDSPSDVAACRRLGSTGPAVRTDGEHPYRFSSRTIAVPVTSPEASPFFGYGVAPETNNLAVRIDAMRLAAHNLGATDLLLVRRTYRDWSYVQGVAYRCRV